MTDRIVDRRTERDVGEHNLFQSLHNALLDQGFRTGNGLSQALDALRAFFKEHVIEIGGEHVSDRETRLLVGDAEAIRYAKHHLAQVLVEQLMEKCEVVVQHTDFETRVSLRVALMTKKLVREETWK